MDNLKSGIFFENYDRSIVEDNKIIITNLTIKPIVKGIFKELFCERAVVTMDHSQKQNFLRYLNKDRKNSCLPIS